jgi:hypothetical protein
MIGRLASVEMDIGMASMFLLHWSSAETLHVGNVELRGGCLRSQNLIFNVSMAHFGRRNDPQLSSRLTATETCISDTAMTSEKQGGISIGNVNPNHLYLPPACQNMTMRAASTGLTTRAVYSPFRNQIMQLGLLNCLHLIASHDAVLAPAYYWAT